MLRDTHSKLVLAVAVLLLWGSSASALVTIDDFQIISKKQPSTEAGPAPAAAEEVPWGLPVTFEATVSGGVGLVECDFAFDDGTNSGFGPCTATHLYTFAGLPGNCQATDPSENPPDLCPDPGETDDPLDVMVTARDESIDPPVSTTIPMRLRRSQGTLLSIQELEDLLVLGTGQVLDEGLIGAIQALQARLDTSISKENRASRKLDDVLGNLVDAKFEIQLATVGAVPISATKDSIAFRMKKAADEVERSLKEIKNAVRELIGVPAGGEGEAVQLDLIHLMRDVVDYLIARVESLDPSVIGSSKDVRQAREDYAKALEKLAEGDFREAAESFLDAYDEVKGLLLPLRQPGAASLPTLKPGSPYNDSERDALIAAINDIITNDLPNFEERLIRSALRDLERAIGSLNDGRLDIILLNFQNARKQDSRATKAISKAIRGLRKVDTVVQMKLFDALFDVICDTIDRVAIEFPPDNVDVNGKRTRDAIARKQKASAELVKSNPNIGKAASDMAKAFDKQSKAACEPGLCGFAP